jgi:hypothetical protein
MNSNSNNSNNINNYQNIKNNSSYKEKNPRDIINSPTDIHTGDNSNNINESPISNKIDKINNNDKNNDPLNPNII